MIPRAAANVCAYLQQHHYPNSFTGDLQVPPKQGELDGIAEFLLKRVDPHFAWPDAPATTGSSKIVLFAKVMKEQLGYAGKLSRTEASNWQTSWEHMLAALAWFVEVLSEADDFRPVADIEDQQQREFFDFFASAYEQYLRGRDKARIGLEEEFRAKFTERITAQQEENESIKERNEELRRQLEDLRVSSLEEQQQQLEQQQNDIAALEEYTNQLRGRVEAGESRLALRQTQLAETQERLKLAEDAKKKLHARFQKQTESNADQLKKGLKSSEAELVQQAGARQRLGASKLEAERMEARNIHAAEDAIKAFTHLATQLQQLLPTEANRPQLPVLALDFTASTTSALLTTDVKTVVKPLIRQLHQELDTRCAQLHAKTLELHGQVDEVMGRLAELSDEAQEKEDRIKVLSSNFQAEKEAMISDSQAYEARIAGLDRDIQQMLEQTTAELLQSDEELRNALERKRKCNLEIEAEETEWKAEVSRVLERVLTHRERISNALSELRGHIEENHAKYVQDI